MELSSVRTFWGTECRYWHTNFLELADEGVAIPRGLTKTYPGLSENGDRDRKAKLLPISIQIFLNSAQFVCNVLK